MNVRQRRYLGRSPLSAARLERISRRILYVKQVLQDINSASSDVQFVSPVPSFSSPDRPLFIPAPEGRVTARWRSNLKGCLDSAENERILVPAASEGLIQMLDGPRIHRRPDGRRLDGEAAVGARTAERGPCQALARASRLSANAARRARPGVVQNLLCDHPPEALPSDPSA